MTLIHKGIRPIHDLQVLDFKRKLYIEEFGDGTYKIWNKKLLKSGCGMFVHDIHLREMRGCYYCPWCDEWFSKNQWREDEKECTP